MTQVPHSIIVFADGASSGNPGPGGWGALVATPDGKVWEIGGGESYTTNNRMELIAAIRALQSLRDTPGKVLLHTDSTYLIQGITQWVWGWRKNGWKTAEGKDVTNKELWEELFYLVARRGKENPIEWCYVRGHTGVPGNERVDQIAVDFSKGLRPRLYQGSILNYDIDYLEIPEDTSLPKRSGDSAKGAAKKAAHSYLSLVNGVPMRHATWPECEARVKGRSGAKFKKAASASEEADILRSWGFPNGI